LARGLLTFNKPYNSNKKGNENLPKIEIQKDKKKIKGEKKY